MSENKKGNPSQNIRSGKDISIPTEKSVEGKKSKIAPPPPPPKPAGQKNTPKTPTNRKG
ncbi:MAG: hypothetical protein HY731_04855 [Candidatus Tectomicrobia bacterium]|nr:hypothetical protein [Candidatus Tectomicrobia bacterium]